MRRLGSLVLSTVLLASLASLTGTAYAGPGRPGPTGPGHHGHHGHHGSPSWRQTVIDPDQGFRGLDAVDRRTAWVTGGSATLSTVLAAIPFLGLVIGFAAWRPSRALAAD